MADGMMQCKCFPRLRFGLIGKVHGWNKLVNVRIVGFDNDLGTSPS